MNGCSRCAILANASTGNDLVFLAATQTEKTKLPRFYSRILTPTETEDYHRHRSTPAGLPFDHYIWLCWSVKESVYKYQKRLYPDLVFAPLQIVISRLDPPNTPGGYYQGIVVGPMPVPTASAAGNLVPGGHQVNGVDLIPAADQVNGADLITAANEVNGIDLIPGGEPGQTLYSRTHIRDGVIMTVVSEDPEFSDTQWGYSTIGSTAYSEQSTAVRTLLLGELKTVLSRDDLRLEKDAAGCPIVLAGDQLLAIPVSLTHHDRYVGYSYRMMN